MDDKLRLLLREIDPKVLGTRIKTARVAAGLTQTEVVAELASAPYVSRIEAGQRRPDLELLAALASRLGTTVEALLTGVDTSRRSQLRLQLDYAELSYVSGELDAALEGVGTLAAEAAEAGADDVARDAAFLHAKVLEGLGRVEEAVGILQRLAADGSPDAKWIEASAALASCYRNLGDPHRAINVGEAALERLRSLGLAGSSEAVKLSLTTAAAYHQVGSVERAAGFCRIAIDEAERLEDDETRARAYWNASVLEYDAGHVESALELARRALVFLERLDDALRQARLRNQMANYLLRLDPPQVEQARENLQVVARTYESTPARPVERLSNRLALARADFLDGDYDSALEGARAVLHETGSDVDPTLAADACALLGKISFAKHDLEAAQAAFREAVLHLTRAGADRTIGEAWFELAIHLDEAGDRDGAAEAYRNAAVSLGLGSHALRPGRVGEARGQ